VVLKSLRGADIHDSPEHRAITSGMVRCELRWRFCEASRHDDGRFGGGATDRL
jgi:hypothetical protein